MFLARSKELMQYQVMEGRKDMQESDTAPVVQVPREPAFVINGVPDFPPDFASGSQLAVRDAPRSRVDYRFGEWLVERKVRKWFENKYYAGTVVRYDSVNNWYTVVYEDGDQEDLEWHELEEILLPLDIAIPLNTLVMDKFKHQNVAPDYGTNVAPEYRTNVAPDYRTNVAPEYRTNVAPDYRTNVATDQMVVRAVNGQQSNNPPLPGWLQASASAGENALVCLKPSDQPKKRGRPRKDISTSGDIQPKKRGRPRKDIISTSGELSKQRSTSGDIQPKKRGRPPKEPGEKSIDRSKLDTVRAEKLKRESMLLRGPPPGSQSF